MLDEITAELYKLTKDVVFVRNLSLTVVIAIASLFALSDLQRHNTTSSQQATITDVSYSETKFIVKRK